MTVILTLRPYINTMHSCFVFFFFTRSQLDNIHCFPTKYNSRSAIKLYPCFISFFYMRPVKIYTEVWGVAQNNTYTLRKLYENYSQQLLEYIRIIDYLNQLCYRTITKLCSIPKQTKYLRIRNSVLKVRNSTT